MRIFTFLMPALLALLVPIFKLTELSVLIWPVILLVDLLAVLLAALAASALPVLVPLVIVLIRRLQTREVQL